MKSSHHFQQSKAGFSQNPTRRNRLTSLLITLMASVAILALSTTSARAFTNYLANPGFELGATGWTYAGDYEYSGNYTNQAFRNVTQFVSGTTPPLVSAHGGTNVFNAWGNYNTWLSHNERRQMFAAAPGSTWTADGWVSTQTPDIMTGNNNGLDHAGIYVDFLNASGTIISSPGNAPGAEVLARNYSFYITSNNTPASVWTHVQVTNAADGSTTLTAPAGTAYVRFSTDFWQPACYTPGGYNAGSAYYDDMALYNTTKPDPEITAQPAPLTLVYGQTAIFSVVADGKSTLSYKWQKDSADITDPSAHGVTNSTLTLSNITTAMMGDYTVTVTDLAGPLTSDQAYLTVLDPGVISLTPALGQTKTAGQSATMTVVAAGSTLPTTYAWQLNGNPLSNDGHFAGTTTSNLTVAGVTAVDIGNYTVLIDGGAAQTNCGLNVVSTSQLATNLLSNPAFEDGVFSYPWESAWGIFNGAALATTNSYYYLTATPVSVYDGTYVAEVYAKDPDNGFNQHVPVTAGVTYHVGGEFYMSSLDPITGLATVTLQASFQGADGRNILPTFAAPVIGTTFGVDVWTALQVTNATGGIDLVAPAGAVGATVQVYEYAQQGGGGAVWVDDLYLTQAALPAPTPVTITASTAGGMMNLSFPSASGVTYEVLYTSSLNSPITWQTNTTITGDGSVKAVSDPIGATKRFYRVLEHH